jgi:hypothetical protein
VSMNSAAAHSSHGEPAPAHNHETEMAEGRLDGETWADMIARQRNSDPAGGPLELLRALPREQQQPKESPGRSELSAPEPGSYQEALLNASRGMGQEQDRDRGINR